MKSNEKSDENHENFMQFHRNPFITKGRIGFFAGGRFFCKSCKKFTPT